MDVADDGTLTRHGARFVGLRELRRLLVACYTGAKYPVKEMLALLQDAGENALDADGPDAADPTEAGHGDQDEAAG